MSLVRNCHIALRLAALVNTAAAAHASGNLVPNPSFEAHTSCPTFYSQLALAAPWSAPTGGTPDYYNACATGLVDVPANGAGSQAALDGDAYAGFFAWSDGADVREYVEVPLSSPLVAGKSYFLIFWVSLADLSLVACDRLGAYVQAGPVGPIAGLSPLDHLTPQVESPLNVAIDNKLGWTPVYGYFVASGGEDHLVIGNFHDDADTNATPAGPGNIDSYYFVDMVRLVEFDPSVYCTPKTNSLGCDPRIVVSGTPSLSSGSGFALTVNNVINNKAGLLFYGTSGRHAAPFQGGTLCVHPPLKRTPVQMSGGSPFGSDCSGVLDVDFNAFLSGGGDPLLQLGDVVDAQFWYRDPASASTTGLSDAAEFVIGS